MHFGTSQCLKDLLNGYADMLWMDELGMFLLNYKFYVFLKRKI